MTTPSEETILAAARNCGFATFGVAFTALDTELIALYRAAYSAGMEAAAVICDERKKRLLQWGLISAASEAGQAADAIRAANGREGKA